MEEIQTIEKQYKLLEDVVEILKHDFIKFNEKKIKIAGLRVKNHLTVIHNLTNLMKKNIIQEIKALPTKHRIIEQEPEVIFLEGEVRTDVDKPVTISEGAVEIVVKPKRTRKANKIKTK